MLALAEKKSNGYRQRALGSVRPVLWEREVGPGVLDGLTDNYVRVEASADSSMVNQVSHVRLRGVKGGVVSAEVV